MSVSQLWLEDLNPAQREAVMHGDGPLLIVAGAGTGKTKTLACRVAHLISCGVPAHRIMLLTFTRRAAREMVTRASAMIGDDMVRRVWGGTFHATSNRLLRIYGSAVGLPEDFTVMDQGDSGDLMGLIRNELGLAKGDKRFPAKATLVRIHSHVANAGTGLSEILKKHFPWCMKDEEEIGRIFEAYAYRKRQQHVLDYDDLLLYWRRLCTESDAADTVADRFLHILVDEYQDTNLIQSAILRGMRRLHPHITVVGDDAQSIYSFRAATIRNILDFPKEFPGTAQVTLDRNYRSTEAILRVSNAVMAKARERYTKELWSGRESQDLPRLVQCRDETEQTRFVCGRILEHLEDGIPLHEQAVLFRAGHHSADLEVELARRNIPFHKFGGLRFIESAHIKDLLAFLRLLENPYDELSWFRVLKLIPGIGARSAQNIMAAVGVYEPAAPPDDELSSETGRVVETRAAMTAVEVQPSPLTRLLSIPPKIPPKSRDVFSAFSQAMIDCLKLPSVEGDEVAPGSVDPGVGPTVAQQVERIRRFYAPIMETVYENPNARLRDLEQLEGIAARYRSRRRFITDLTLDPPNATSDLARDPYLDEDWLTLSTIHSAKGCEWKVVHILHAADGMIPSDMAVGEPEGIDEERRLFYVAMTRAKDHLYVYFPLRYYFRGRGLGDGHNYAQVTRFLTREALALMNGSIRAPALPSTPF